MKRIIEWVFGPDWKTSLSGFMASLTALLIPLSLLAESLTPVRDTLPEGWWQYVTLASAVATFILRIINARVQKDATKTTP